MQNEVNQLAGGGHTAGSKYFEELLERVRSICASEKNFYLKVRDIFATMDYDSRSNYAKDFFATVQNKFHYAITGYTAAEPVANRINIRFY